MNTLSTPRAQHGVILLEALIGLAIFMVGALAMIALQANGIAAQSDAQYRIEAANQADKLIGEINAHADRTNPAGVATPPNLAASLQAMAYNTGGVTASCVYNGGTLGVGNVDVAQWSADVSQAVGNSPDSMHQVLVDTANFNKITVAICWQNASDQTPHRHTVVAYVN